jgi:RNA polymerase sigma factor (sigma-70 family)
MLGMPRWSWPSAAGGKTRWRRSTAATAARCTRSPAGCSATRAGPRKWCRRSSCACGTTPNGSTRTEGSLRSFLLANSHGRAVDQIRADTSRRNREARDARQTAGAGYDIDREVWDLTLAEQIKAALGELPDEEKRAIELAYFGGHTYREVAALLDQPEGTVKSRIRNGLRRLQTTLRSVGQP